MKTITSFSAAALLAAPFCIVAQAADLDSIVKTGFDLHSRMADAFQGITINNMDVLYERLWELQPEFLEYARILDSLSEEDERKLLNHPTFMDNIRSQHVRCASTINKIEAALRHASMEKIDIYKDVRELHNGMLRGIEVARSPRIPKKGASAQPTPAPAAAVSEGIPSDKVAFCKQEGVAVYEALADMFEKATPDTLDQLHKQIVALKPRFQKLQQVKATMSRQEQSEVYADNKVAQDASNAIMRLMNASVKLQGEVDTSSAEQQAQIQLITEEIQNLMSNG